MAASRQDIERWFDAGVEQGAKHMLVICDSFDWSDYPVYTETDEACMERYRNPGEMQSVMEVYDLQKDKAEQMNATRVFNLPKAES